MQRPRSPQGSEFWRGALPPGNDKRASVRTAARRS